ncbi:MAG TPA: hypothetical protein VF651_10520 [Gammaproteobacteria bacterium]
MALDVTADDIARNPAWHLYDIDMQRGELHFLEATPETFRISAFLDNRIAYTGDRLHGFPLDTVARAVAAQPAPEHDPAFLFHSSFCCSSLLARSLQLEGRVLALREPWVLRRIADLKRGVQARGQAWYPQGPQLLDLALRLLAKTWQPSESVLIKPTHVAHNLAAEALELRPRAKGLLLHSDLETFLVSNLKKTEDTKQKTPALLRLFDQDTGYARRFPALALDRLDYLQSLVVIWHAQMLKFQELLASAAGARLRSLDSARLLAEPAAMVQAAAGFLELPLTAADAEASVAGPVWNTHAKDPFSAYDSAQRDAEGRDIVARHGPELRAALLWSETLFRAASPGLAGEQALTP